MRKFCQNLQNAQLCRPKTGILSAFLPSAAGQNSDTFPVLHTVERGVSLQGREKIGDVPLPSCRFASSHTPPFVAMRHLPPERGKSSLKGTAFGGGNKVFGTTQRRPLGGAGCERSEQTEGVSSSQSSSPSPSLLRKSTSPKGRGLGKEMKFAWTAKGSPFGRAVTVGD